MTNTHLDSVLEWRCLGHLTDPKFYDYIYKITVDLFTHDRKAVYEAIRQSHMVYGEVTPEGIEYFLNKQSPSQLDVAVGTNVEAIIDRLVDVATRRQLKEKARRLELIADATTLETHNIQRELEFVPMLQEDNGDITEGSQILLANYHRKKSGTYRFIKTGFPTLDLFLGNEWPRELMLLGGLPGTGKTVLAFQSQIEMARQHGIRSTMINLEMDKDALIARGAAHLAEVDAEDIKTASLSDDEEVRFERAVNEINTLPIDIVCARGKDVHWIIGVIRKFASQGSKVFFVDHLQLIRTASANRNLELGEVTDVLKTVADKYDVHIVLLTQLTKDGGDYKVRDSGVVETLVDTFMVMSAESKDDIRRITFSLKKNREGKLGEFQMLFYSKWQRFVDAATPRVPVAVAAD